MFFNLSGHVVEATLEEMDAVDTAGETFTEREVYVSNRPPPLHFE
jgi:hypothetical protein